MRKPPVLQIESWKGLQMIDSISSLETYEVTFEPSEKTIVVKEGQTLLDAAIRSGLHVKYGCRHGSCSACKCKVLDGEYEIMDRVSDYSLMEFERDEGCVLLCSTTAQSDLVLEVEEEESDLPFFPVYDFESIVEINRQVTEDIHMIRLRLLKPNQISYEAGQFFEINIPDNNETRTFSLASRFENKNTVDFIVKRVNNGVGSNYLCDLQAGAKVTGSGPYGKLRLHSRSKDLLFVAGGSGLGPIKALLEELFSDAFEKEAWVFFGVKTEKDLFLIREMEEMSKLHPNLHFIPALSEEDPLSGWTGEIGFVSDVVARSIESAKDMDVYICGPQIMIEMTCDVLYKNGVEGTNIFYDEF